jgi:NAD(P)-dependent dehydrogenase (short-subunit alcohol dehydrogenase family)
MGRDDDFEGRVSARRSAIRTDADELTQVFALTGGASGIGLATARILHSRGATVAIGDLDEAALDNATKLISPNGKDRFLATKVNVAKRSEVDSWISDVVSKFGRLDGAANCAGVIGRHHGTRAVEDLEDDQWDLIIGVNLTGMMYALRAELQVMKGPGSVVCVSSVQGTLGFAKHAAYSASKHGVLGLVRSAAKEVGERNIRVNAVTP